MVTDATVRTGRFIRLLVLPSAVTAGELPDDLHFGSRSVYVESADTLVVADVHVGRDADSRVELPLGERRDLTGRLSALLEEFDPETVVVAGDLLHAFGRLPDVIAADVAAVSDVVETAGATLVVTPGNHDTMLGEAGVGVTEPVYRLADDETVVCHGHEPPGVEAGRFIVGHAHPAIKIEGRKHPCFLFGSGVYRGADVLVLPAFSRLARGAAINGMVNGDSQSPLLSAVQDFRPIVYDEDAGEALTFPPLGKLRPFL